MEGTPNLESLSGPAYNHTVGRVRGDKNEAVAYVAEFGELWTRTPGALSWVASASRSGQ